MGLLARAVATEFKSGGDNYPLDLFRAIYGGRTSSAGKTINLQTALQTATVLACSRTIAEGIAQPPIKLQQLSEDEKTSTPARDHPLYWLLYRRPNDFQTSFEYRETIGLHLVLCGNAYSFINRVRGKIVELIPIEPNRVTVKCDSEYQITYEISSKTSGASQTFPPESVWHIRGPSWCGYLGMDAVYMARDIIGLSIALEESQARFHANGARPSGLISVEGTLKDEQYKQLRAWLDREHNGSESAGKTMLLDRNAKWLQQAMTGVDAQHLESRKYQCEEICRAMRVMPIMVGYSDKATTYASSEQMFLSHVIHTLTPWHERIAQSIDVNLLSEADSRSGIYAKFLVGGLLRGSMADTSMFLKNMVSETGALTRNEARQYLDYNPIEGLDEPLIPPRTTLEPVPGAPTPAGNAPAPTPAPGATP
jgi:HK97 family phage portal protein